MMHRINPFGASSPGELVEGIFMSLLPSTEPASGHETDGSLDVLLKNAMRDAAGAEADADQVWSRLRAKVRGPFGQLAVEGPGVSSTESTMLATGGAVLVSPFDAYDPRSADRPSARPKGESARDTMNVDLFRPPELGFLMR